MKLYEIAQGYEQVRELAENGEITEQALADTIESLEYAFEDKVESIACIIKEQKGMAEMITNEIKHLTERKRVLERSATRLQDYLITSMQTAGKTAIKTARAAVSVHHTGTPSVIIDDNDTAYAQARKLSCIITEEKLDKRGLMELIKAGNTIDGIRLQYSDYIKIK